MKSAQEIKRAAIQTIETEINAVSHLLDYINENFVKSVEVIHNSKGKVVITGVGKSANIANKIVATLNSTGTPALFMHATDAIHGDLGNMLEEDVVICISKSGNTAEIKSLIPLIKNMGNTIIAMVGSMESFLAEQSDFILNTSVEREACPNNLAPTSSTTAQLVMGDALAVCLLECNNFSSENFARFHPGGTLGKRLLLKVSDIYIHNEAPVVNPAANIQSVIIEISEKRLGATAVIDDGKLIGIVTDGDLRRMLEKGSDINALKAKDIMSCNPKTIEANELAAKALEYMEENNITQLLVVEGSEYRGMIHLHDILKEGII